MGLLDTELVGSILPGGAAGELPLSGIDVTQVVTEALPSLHASTAQDLVFWTEGELIEWIDESVKRLAIKAGVFIGRDTTVLTAAGQSTYPLPARHLSTRHVSYGSTPLKPANSAEMEVLDPAYQTTPGAPVYWYQDLLGMSSIGLAPVPAAQQTLANIYEGYPEATDAGKQQTIVPGPAPLKGYLGMCLLAEAYGREGEMEMPDVAAHCRGMVEMYERVFLEYFGRGI